MQFNHHEAENILANAEVVFTNSELNNKIEIMAQEISNEISKEVPVFLTVMNGGLFFAATLLQKIHAPIIVDYIHASRYGDATIGSSHITWFRQPSSELIKNRLVYIIDDILDEGYTLVEIKRFILSLGAKACKIVVLVDKDLQKVKPIVPDYVGLVAPKKFLFGYGMDIHGLYRQLPDIYAYSS